MGLVTKLATAATKSIAKEATKKITSEHKKQETSNQMNALIQYTMNNLECFSKVVFQLQQETNALISIINDFSNRRLSFEEKRKLKNCKEKAEENLSYLYLCKGYFVYLSKIVNDISLEETQYTFIIKFAPFFDGKKVMKPEAEPVDISLLGQAKAIGKAFTGDFSSPFSSHKVEFCFDTYLEDYQEQIKNLILPNIQTEIEKFEKAVFPDEISLTNAVSDNEEIICPTCQKKLKKSEKFCSECGTKIEVAKPKFCSECGAKLTSAVKFCSECGHRCE